MRFQVKSCASGRKFGRVKICNLEAELGRLSKRERRQTLAVLHAQCERVGVSYAYERRQAPSSAGSSVDPVN